MQFKSFFKSNLFLILAFAFIFLAGWQLGYAGFQFKLRVNPPQITVENKSPQTSTVDFSLLWQVIEQINQKYLFGPVDGKKLLYGAVSGLVEALGDPYTSFLNPEDNSQFAASLNGVYEGIGAEIGIRNEELIIVAPLDGSPAKGAGVRAGDKILKINGESTSGITIAEAVSKIRGEKGTQVVLTLGREGKEGSFEVAITRDQIKVDSVTWEDEGDGIYRIEVSRFGEDTNSQWDTAVSQIKKQGGSGVKGIILDVRSNPGGYLSAAVYVASEFVEDGAIVIQEESSGGRRTLSAQETSNNHGFLGVPTVVLIDGGSASASEIVAGALRERVGATLVGETTFGKGTVQDAVDFNDGSGLHITVAKWLTPKGNWVHEKGLRPDVSIDLTDEDVNQDRDPQLEKALELIR